MILETSDSQTIYYQTYGDPGHRPLLLLHGLGADHTMWQPQIERYPAEGLYLVAPDMRGHGRSPAPPAFSLQDCARDMSELLAALELDTCTVAGVSMGGLIAQQMALDHAGVVDKLVIADSFSGPAGWVDRFNARLASFLLAVLPASLQTRLLVTTYQRMGKPEVAGYFQERIERQDQGRLREMRREVNGFDVLPRLPEIQAPALVLVGDGFGKAAINMARRTAEGLPEARFAILPGGGDPSNLLAPEAFDEALLAFVRPTLTVSQL